MNPVPRQGSASAIDESLLLVEICCLREDVMTGITRCYSRTRILSIYREIISNKGTYFIEHVRILISRYGGKSCISGVSCNTLSITLFPSFTKSQSSSISDSCSIARITARIASRCSAQILLRHGEFSHKGQRKMTRSGT